jgi:hypothetical protein
VSRIVRLALAFGRCPLWLSCLLVNWQALHELTEASNGQREGT